MSPYHDLDVLLACLDRLRDLNCAWTLAAIAHHDDLVAGRFAEMERGLPPLEEHLAAIAEEEEVRLRATAGLSEILELPDDPPPRLGDIVEDQNAVDPFEELQDKSMTHMVLDFLDELPDREAVILRRRFGLDGDKEETLEEIGQRFGVTRERIRQLQNIALTKLRRMVEKMEEVQEVAA